MDFTTLMIIGAIAIAIVIVYINDKRKNKDRENDNSGVNPGIPGSLAAVWPDTFTLPEKEGLFTIHGEHEAQKKTVLVLSNNKLYPVGEAVEKYPDQIAIRQNPTDTYPYPYRYVRSEFMTPYENNGFIFSGAGTVDEADTLKDVIDQIMARGLKVSDFEIVEK